MKKHTLLSLMVILLGIANIPVYAQPDDLTEQSEQTVQLLGGEKLLYIELSGTPCESGLSYGKQLKKEIHEIIFKEDLRQTANVEPDEFITSFLSQTDFEQALQKWIPHLLDELKGISEGSGIDFETIMMHQLGEEYWFNTQDVLAHHCSSFGVNKSTDHPSMAAQNMDIPPFYYSIQGEFVLPVNIDSLDRINFNTGHGKAFMQLGKKLKIHEINKIVIT